MATISVPKQNPPLAPLMPSARGAPLCFPRRRSWELVTVLPSDHDPQSAVSSLEARLEHGQSCALAAQEHSLPLLSAPAPLRSQVTVAAASPWARLPRGFLSALPCGSGRSAHGSSETDRRLRAFSSAALGPLLGLRAAGCARAATRTSPAGRVLSFLPAVSPEKETHPARVLRGRRGQVPQGPPVPPKGLVEKPPPPLGQGPASSEAEGRKQLLAVD